MPRAELPEGRGLTLGKLISDPGRAGEGRSECVSGIEDDSEGAGGRLLAWSRTVA